MEPPSLSYSVPLPSTQSIHTNQSVHLSLPLLVLFLGSRHPLESLLPILFQGPDLDHPDPPASSTRLFTSIQFDLLASLKSSKTAFLVSHINFFPESLSSSCHLYESLTSSRLLTSEIDQGGTNCLGTAQIHFLVPELYTVTRLHEKNHDHDHNALEHFVFVFSYLLLATDGSISDAPNPPLQWHHRPQRQSSRTAHLNSALRRRASKMSCPRTPAPTWNHRSIRRR